MNPLLAIVAAAALLAVLVYGIAWRARVGIKRTVHLNEWKRDQERQRRVADLEKFQALYTERMRQMDREQNDISARENQARHNERMRQEGMRNSHHLRH